MKTCPHCLKELPAKLPSKKNKSSIPPIYFVTAKHLIDTLLETRTEIPVGEFIELFRQTHKRTCKEVCGVVMSKLGYRSRTLRRGKLVRRYYDLAPSQKEPV